MMLQISLIFLIIPISGIIGTLIPGYILAPLFLYIYKKTIGYKMDFGIQNREKPEKFRNTWKGIFPALLVINLSLLVGTTDFAQDLLISLEYLATPLGPNLSPLIGFLVLIPIMAGIGAGIFSPVWFLLDSGIVFTNKKKVEEKIDPIEVRSMGGWYHYLLKGYAGIGVIVVYIQFLGKILENFHNPLDGGFLSSAIFLPIMPILISIFLIPSMILLDITLNSRRNFVRDFAKKRLNIEGPLEDPLNIQVK
jgi:hypothetical protein